MKIENILYAVVGIFLGFVGGFFLANSLNRREILQQNGAQISTANAPFAGQTTQAADIKEAHPPTENAPTQAGKPLPEVAEKIERATNQPNDFAAQIEAGNLYLRIKGADKAEEFFDRAAATNPKDFEAQTRLGNGYFDAGKYEKAEKWYIAALERKPSDANVRTDLGITFVERAAPDFDRAVREFQTVLEANPKFEPAIYNRAVVQLKKGDSAAAAQSLAELEAINPQSSATARLRQIINK